MAEWLLDAAASATAAVHREIASFSRGIRKATFSLQPAIRPGASASASGGGGAGSSGAGSAASAPGLALESKSAAVAEAVRQGQGQSQSQGGAGVSSTLQLLSLVVDVLQGCARDDAFIEAIGYGTDPCLSVP